VVSSLLYTDLDNFKDVNDTIGHSAGDDVLVILVDLLKAALRTEDIVFGWGETSLPFCSTGLTAGKPCLRRSVCAQPWRRIALSCRAGYSL